MALDQYFALKWHTEHRQGGLTSDMPRKSGTDSRDVVDDQRAILADFPDLRDRPDRSATLRVRRELVI
jgi:hypothetical protein